MFGFDSHERDEDKNNRDADGDVNEGTHYFRTFCKFVRYGDMTHAECCVADHTAADMGHHGRHAARIMREVFGLDAAPAQTATEAPPYEHDGELDRINAILDALTGLDRRATTRVMRYVIDRTAEMLEEREGNDMRAIVGDITAGASDGASEGAATVQ